MSQNIHLYKVTTDTLIEFDTCHTLAPMMPRGTRFSDGCTPGHSQNFRRVLDI